MLNKCSPSTNSKKMNNYYLYLARTRIVPDESDCNHTLPSWSIVSGEHDNCSDSALKCRKKSSFHQQNYNFLVAFSGLNALFWLPLCCGKKFLTSRISGPDKYRQVLLGFRMGVYRPMLENIKSIGSFWNR
jgi:hypothetical protein